ncbi:MFS transporter [Saccharothrix syringae]|uniref:MFS transporter n=1 Tax=Saccharothrix syringae TaxID=103733 RepID=A0A5Q0H6M9_SACSY|nr:MFS transporter [Saccharothrix syringae]QFZ21613.1 MFS transporter [Saccharothrix syringae]
MTATAEVRGGPLSGSYLSFVAATGLSSLGDAAWVLALTTALVGATSATAAGAVLALAGVPRVVALLGGGVVADRYGPVRVMVWADLLRGAVMAAAAVVVLAVGPSVPVLAVAAAALTVLGAFFVPASGALRPLLLPEEQLVRGNALYLVGLRTGQAAGGPAGAGLLALGGVVAVALANAASFLVSAVAVARVRPGGAPGVGAPAGGSPPRRRFLGGLRHVARGGTAAPARGRDTTPFTRRVAEGLRHVAGDPGLRLLVVVVGLVELAAAGPVNIGLVLLADGIGAGTTGAGLLLSAFTAGATLAFVASLVRPVGRRAGAALLVGVGAQAAVLACLGLVGSLTGALVGYGLLGLVTAQTGVVLTSLVQRRTPAAVRGRVMSILSLVVFGAPLLGNAGIGAAVDLLGLTTTMVLHGLLAVAAVCAYASSPVLRGARLD